MVGPTNIQMKAVQAFSPKCKIQKILSTPMDMKHCVKSQSDVIWNIKEKQNTSGE